MNQASLYSSSSGLQRRDAEAVLREFAPRLRWRKERDAGEGEDAVLDVGCGTGDVTATLLLPLLPADVRVAAVDVSSAMVVHAAAAHCHPRLRFLQGDIAAADLRATRLWAEAGPSGFCKIFSFYCLHWIPDQRAALVNMRQLLRPEGEALLVFLAKCPVFTMYESLSRTTRWQPYMTDAFKFISPYQHSDDPGRDFCALLTEVGFSIVECRCLDLTYDFGSMDVLADAIMAINPFVERIPSRDKSEFLLDSLKEIRTQKLVSICADNTQQSIVVKYSLLVAHITKQQK